MENFKRIVKTSYSISAELENRLLEAAVLCSLPKIKLLKKVLEKYLNTLKRAELVHGNTVMYNRPKNGTCIIRTVRWTAEEYSIMQQCRFYMRLSVSFIISMAIEEKLDEIVRATLRLRKRVKSRIKSFFNKQLRLSRNFLIYWPYIKTNEVPFLAQRWDKCLL